MAVTSALVLKLLSEIAKEEVNADLTVTMSAASQGAIKVGATTLISSLFLGPVGFIVGSVGGGVWAYATSSNFKPLHAVLEELTKEEKNRLAQVALKHAGEIGLDLGMATLLTSSPEARAFLVEVLKRLGLSVKD
ncbi:protein C19orf12 homolog [Xenia sp. Carnegie-2017]|uniref:protein C19orf12 homolog n=1 Tax=Xenia sp. Carnegie-2017 TaxID=2897299 RepID=UPI001F0463C7|nr:protein C19orf12 homolog [Xenia sp. Carnegie-2017]